MLVDRIGWRARARLGVGAVVLGTLVASATAADARAASIRHRAVGSGFDVATTDGTVQGMTTGTAEEFLGIPYAAPPVGPLRWRPPQPAARWPGPRDATRFAPHCPQPATPFGAASTSEDCLYLNVFRPAAHASGAFRRPV